MSKYKINTTCVQGGYEPGNGEPRQVPIYQSTTFKYATSEDMGKLFDLEADGYFYSRLQNPTNDLVAKKICQLEGGAAAMLTGSGQAANFYAVFNIANCGDHVVASNSIYGGTYNLFAVTMKKMGIDFTFVDPDASEDEIRAAFRPNTKALFGEIIANPALTVLDIEKFAKVAHEQGVPLIVDNTFPTPINCRPIEWGADIVTHSTTKYMDGHGAAVGGCIVDAGKFDWMKYADKFPGLTTPDDSYHGITYAEKFGKEGAFITKATAQLMRDFGSVQSPQSAFILNLGLESLHVRVKRHCENALAVAKYLEQNDKHSKDNTQNKTIRIIVSGGQGPGEDISEAQAMKDYLCAHGIEASRIFMEAQSTDTEKNIAYSARFIPDKNAKIGVVSNDFHLFRAGMLVRAKGFHNVSTIAARSDEVLFLNYRVREYFGVLKDLFGVKFFHFIGE